MNIKLIILIVRLLFLTLRLYKIYKRNTEIKEYFDASDASDIPDDEFYGYNKNGEPFKFEIDPGYEIVPYIWTKNIDGGVPHWCNWYGEEKCPIDKKDKDIVWDKREDLPEWNDLVNESSEYLVNRFENLNLNDSILYFPQKIRIEHNDNAENQIRIDRITITLYNGDGYLVDSDLELYNMNTNSSQEMEGILPGTDNVLVLKNNEYVEYNYKLYYNKIGVGWKMPGISVNIGLEGSENRQIIVKFYDFLNNIVESRARGGSGDIVIGGGGDGGNPVVIFNDTNMTRDTAKAHIKERFRNIYAQDKYIYNCTTQDASCNVVKGEENYFDNWNDCVDTNSSSEYCYLDRGEYVPYFDRYVNNRRQFFRENNTNQEYDEAIDLYDDIYEGAFDQDADNWFGSALYADTSMGIYDDITFDSSNFYTGWEGADTSGDYMTQIMNSDGTYGYNILKDDEINEQLPINQEASSVLTYNPSLDRYCGNVCFNGNRTSNENNE